MTIRIHSVSSIIATLCETTITNNHSLQFPYSDQYQFFCHFKAIITHSQLPQTYKATQINYSHFLFFTTVITNYNLHNQVHVNHLPIILA